MIRKRATVDVLGQRGDNITMCPAISSDGFLSHKPLIGPHNTEHLISFLHDLYGRVVPGEGRVAVRQNRPTFVIAWANVAYHHSHTFTEWFTAPPRNLWLNAEDRVDYCICIGRWCIYK